MKIPHPKLVSRFVSLFTIATITFLALLSTAQAQTPWKFIVMGDTRGTGTSDQIDTVILTELSKEILARNPAFVLVSGDLVYSGNLDAFQAWRNLMAPVYNAGIGVFPVIGNHDATDPSSFIQVFGSDVPDNGPTDEVNRRTHLLTITR